ncbi:DNA mismatch repair protein MutT [Bacilli bacterium]|nr:DNA mismatch repair protein MutT [Bacilli bacterium]GHU43001.1 DNA mismatch repair protein MutT [Bacilli bacterium]
MTVKLIAHSLIKKDNQYLLIQRTDIKRGKKNVYPSYWDIPGGSVEPGETPQQGAQREAMEEVNLTIALGKIIHEDSHYDVSQKTVFTRLVYDATISACETLNIKLDPEEHQNYIWLSSLNELKGEKIVPYVYDILPHQ